MNYRELGCCLSLKNISGNFKNLGNFVSFPKISRQFFDYIPTLVDIYSRYVDIFLS